MQKIKNLIQKIKKYSKMKKIMEYNENELIQKYFDGELSDEAEKELEESAQNNPELQQKMNDYKNFLLYLDELEVNNFKKENPDFFEEIETLKQENQTPKTKEVKKLHQSFFQKNKKIIFTVAAGIALCVSVGTIYYLNQPNKDKSMVKNIKLNTNKKTEKSPLNTKNQTEKSLVINEDSLKKIADVKKQMELLAMIEKEKENQKKLSNLPKSQKNEMELYADNFIQNAKIDGDMLPKKSISKTIKMISPRNDEVFKDIISFNFEDNDEKVENYTLQIVTNNVQNVFTKKFNKKEIPFKVDFLKNEPGLYYFTIECNGEEVYVGRFLFKKQSEK